MLFSGSYRTYYLVYRKQGGKNIIEEYYIEPDVLVPSRKGSHKVGRSGDKRHAYRQQQERHQDAHEGLEPLSEIFSGDVGHVETVVPHRKHPGEVVMDRTHENTAENYPEIGHRSVCRSHYRTEDGPETGDVEELYHKYLPHRHHLVVNAVGQGLSRGLSGAVRSEETVRKFPVKEESRHKQEDGNEKCYHCSQY